jgi:hypothetical protein
VIAAVVKNILMGVSVGGVYHNVTDPVSILGALFQGGLFIALGMFSLFGTKNHVSDIPNDDF